MASLPSDPTKRLNTLQQIVAELITPRPLEDLFELILTTAMDLIQTEAGSLYTSDPTTKELIFQVAKNRIVKFPFLRSKIPKTDRGIATYCLRNSKALRIQSVENISQDAPYTFDYRFDKISGFQTRSILAVPIRTSRLHTFGVIQLINPMVKDAAFTEDDENLLMSFSAIVGAALENNTLYNNIQNLFEGFVQASVNAIEARDPTTRGHSERVALLTVELAKQVSRSDGPDVRDISFTERQLVELRHASLLHDFGKIMVSERTLLKAEKLHPHEKELLQQRLQLFRAVRENNSMKEFINEHLKSSKPLTAQDWANVRAQMAKFDAEQKQQWNTLLEINKSTVLDESKDLELQRLAHVAVTDADGNKHELLCDDHKHSLRVKRGSLTPEERFEIENHVKFTYQFLKQIPWSNEFASIPDIAGAHHEKLDGSGYPEKLKGEKIPLQSRLMTISDIYDALVASDRPYKAALPVERALSILEAEVKAGKLDGRFLKVFIDAKVYQMPAFEARLQGSKKAA